MSYNGSGTFNINSAGQPVVAGTVISATAFNALTADLGVGLSTAITKDGQTTTTARITFAQGVTSSLTTDSSSTTTGSIITAGGVGIAKALYVGTNANVAGTLAVTGVATFSAAPIYSSLTASSAVATDASKALVSVTNTGTGNNVLATSPTLVTPILGTPASGSLVNCTDTNYTGFKNRIINGAMVIDQRNAGAAVTVNNATDFYPVDRFLGFGELSDGVYTLQQSSTAPAGFVNSIIATVTTADASVGSSQYYFLSHRIEGTNCSDFGFGTANAKTVTLSFWVRSSLTGQFGGSLTNGAFNRAYPFTYTINSANTWEQKSVTVAGDTSGTWLTTTGIGMRIYWDIGSGSSNVGTAGAWGSIGYVGATGDTKLISTNGATFYITGVQLEKGSVATSFDYRPYGTELALCQRYYQKSFPQGTAPAQNIGGVGAVYSQSPAASGSAPAWVNLPVVMRATPTTITTYNPSAANANWRNISASSDVNSQIYSSSQSSIYIIGTTQTVGQYQITAIHYTAEAEL